MPAVWRGLCEGYFGMSEWISRVGLALFLGLTMSACATRSAPPVTPPATSPTEPPVTREEPRVIPAEPRVVPREPPAILEVRQGLASYYGPGFEGKKTASGIPFDKSAMVAAHPTYPFGTVVRVTNLANKRHLDLRVVDRGPAKGPRSEGVLIDVSEGAAANLGFIRQGRTRVRIEVLRWGSKR